MLLDFSEQVQIDELNDTKVFIAASSETVFIRNCSNCVFAVACKQFRMRDCKSCSIYLFSTVSRFLVIMNMISSLCYDFFLSLHMYISPNALHDFCHMKTGPAIEACSELR